MDDPRSSPGRLARRADGHARRAPERRDIKETDKQLRMAYPEGYRKAMRTMELAERHGYRS